MKRHSFFVKLFFGNLLLVAIIVGIGGFLSYRRLNATHVAESRAHQLGVLRMARVYFQRRWPELDGRVPRIDADCKLLATGADMRLTVIAADGRVLGDSEADPLRMENHNTPDRREVQIALKGRQGVQIRAS
jgi:two-component system phosphate regulon sensor histidine kinase PhoR